MTVGERIKECRKKLGMTQDELARAAGYKSRSIISKIEKNDRDIPRRRILELAKLLHTTPTYLMGWEENKPYTARKVKLKRIWRAKVHRISGKAKATTV